MNILFIVWNFYPNTAYTNHTKATVRGMHESGCQVDVLSLKPTLCVEQSCIVGQSVVAGGWGRTAVGTLKDFGLLMKSIKVYDLIYCACSNMCVIRLAMWLARKHHIPIVHERTEFPDIFYSNSSTSQKALKRYLQSVALFDRIFVISHPIKDYFIDNGVPVEKLHIYPMIVDPHRFDGLTKQNVGYRYMAYCGNLSNSKDGVADLIEAYGRSKSKDKYRLMLIGAKPSSKEMKNYDEIISRYKIVENVIFRGQVNREEMPQLLTDAEVLLLCRPDNRQALGGFPTKLGEYLSTGNPVLVTKVGDIDKYIVDGKNGYLASPGSVKEFSEKMDYIVDHYEEAVIVGKQGRELALNEFNYSVQTRSVVNVLKSLV